MNLIRNIFGSSLGKKCIMAITGGLLFVFVVLHLIGNLQIFLGAEALNRYGAFLQSNVELLWPARIGLLLLVALHIWSAVTLTIENRRARPVAYEMNKNTGSSYASRTMMMSGLIVAAFVIYHILHFTVQVKEINLIGEDFLAMHDAKGRHDVFGMMVAGFSNPWVSLFYIIGMALLCLHLSHGVSAMFQSIGLKDGAWSAPINSFSKIAALLIFLGYVSIPISIYVFHYGTGGCCK
jgi:succinate dehydrogenase / fumarate reductase, cytochrome b subunit